jgi:hypothetical protein
MKTLKELLFERHRDAEPGLELARQEFLGRGRSGAAGSAFGTNTSSRCAGTWPA